jgi:S1-C subfamily serine protease
MEGAMKMKRIFWYALSAPVVYLIILFISSMVAVANAHENSIKINSMLNPSVQINVNGGGSGTLFKVRGKFSYIVTNHHVIARALWLRESPDHQERTFIRKDVSVNIYTHKKGKVAMKTFTAYIYAWDEKKDIAILRIEHRAKYVVKMYTSKYLRIFDAIIMVGTPLRNPPRPSIGVVTFIKDDSIGISAAIIFGNSGGAAFIERKGEFLYVGMPEGISTIRQGPFEIPITHLGLMIPSDVVMEFIHKQGL